MRFVKGEKYMKIYSFADLTEMQRRKLYDFIIKFGSNYYFNTYDEYIEVYKGVVFNKGTTFYSLWDMDRIKGTIGLITKDVCNKGEVFITAINILEHDKSDFKILLEKCIADSIKVGSQKLKLGIQSNKEYLIPAVEAVGFSKVYEAIILKLNSSENLKRVKSNQNISFKNLSKENKLDFKDVHNKGFLNSPNGAMLTNEQIDEMLLKNKQNPNLVGICYLNHEAVGIYELKTVNEVGWIEAIAIAPKWHGKGLGKILLKNAVDCLYDLGIEEIKLMVISSNKIAYKLYLKYGYREEKVTSYWFEIDVNEFV